MPPEIATSNGVWPTVIVFTTVLVVVSIAETVHGGIGVGVGGGGVGGMGEPGDGVGVGGAAVGVGGGGQFVDWTTYAFRPSARIATDVGPPGTGIVAVTVPVARSIRLTGLLPRFATSANPPELGIAMSVGD